ncbi:MAG TPA: hypothetical protein VJK30_07020 [Coxiellaceae bacterium]|nr:MAG: hypothetical protein A3E81_07790 [Gammaproteobacteria bacterium RIFCSPHIGHO2_12_FULL_36_30]HLB57060.1 hypothetical protein [Coxiellaceae bacterium]
MKTEIEKCVIKYQYIKMCKKIISLQDKLLPLFIASLFGVIGFIFLVFGFVTSKYHLEFLANKDLFTASAAMFAATGLMYAVYCNQALQKEKLSKFYLREIQRYLKNSLEYISSVDNNNVKWHRSVNSLTAVEDLYHNLTEKNHKEIFLRDYTDIGFAIADVVNSVNPYFFYGIEYQKYLKANNGVLLSKDEIHRILFMHSGGISFDLCRISADALNFLCAFYEKANFIWFRGSDAVIDDWSNGEKWFKKIDNNYLLKDFTVQHSPLVEKINEYVFQCNLLREEFLKERITQKE